MIHSSFFQLLSRLQFSTPEHAQVVVFHRDGSDVLSQTVLEGIPYSVLDVRRETWYLSARIVCNTFRNAVQYRGEGNRIPARRRFRFLLGLLQRAYVLACFGEIRPRVVLTYIDNDYVFAWLSRHYDKATFYTIQNGMRSLKAWYVPSNAQTPLHGIS